VIPLRLPAVTKKIIPHDHRTMYGFVHTDSVVRNRRQRASPAFEDLRRPVVVHSPPSALWGNDHAAFVRDAQGAGRRIK
jgi:hypothetical protein